MSLKTWKHGTIVSCLLVLAVIIAAVILANVHSENRASVKPTVKTQVIPAPNLGSTNGCAQSVKYYAYSAPKGSNHFGPAIQSQTTQAAMKRFELKECTDPLFAAVIVSFLKGNVSGVSPSQVEITAKKFVSDRRIWRAAVNKTNRKIRTSKVVFSSASYETLLMVPGRNRRAMPKLGKTSRPVKVGWALQLTLKNGAKRLLRLVCDLQPAQPHFSRFGIIHRTSVPAKTKSVKVSVPSSVATTPVKSPTTPTPTKSCNCVSTTQASQPVQDPNSPIKVNTGSTPGAPTSKPTNTAPKPVTNTNTPAPDPTSEGSNSGSSDGSTGVPSGSSSGGGTTTTGSDNGTSNPVCGSAACTSVNSGSSAPPS